MLLIIGLFFLVILLVSKVDHQVALVYLHHLLSKCGTKYCVIQILDVENSYHFPSCFKTLNWCHLVADYRTNRHYKFTYRNVGKPCQFVFVTEVTQFCITEGSKWEKPSIIHQPILHHKKVSILVRSKFAVHSSKFIHVLLLNFELVIIKNVQANTFRWNEFMFSKKLLWNPRIP